MRTSLAAAVLAATLATLTVPAAATAAQGGPSPFRRDLRRIDGRLRMGIETAPIALGEKLSASETVCHLAEKMGQAGDAHRADADWSTLGQLVEEEDRPAAQRVDGVLERADTGLRELGEKYASAWSDAAKVAQLRRGVARAREGVRMLRAAMATVAGSFDAWSGHRCQDATDAIEAGVARIPAAVGRINIGMTPLWRLALPG